MFKKKKLIKVEVTPSHEQTLEYLGLFDDLDSYEPCEFSDVVVTYLKLNVFTDYSPEVIYAGYQFYKHLSAWDDYPLEAEKVFFDCLGFELNNKEKRQMVEVCQSLLANMNRETINDFVDLIKLMKDVEQEE
ncbi:hypothetical protein [Vibrio cholerae]|uniref:hypothetical protein n=1 Tax=Vibrio cholerae TaxID=666 RepID=UPI0006E5A2BF|nr:hypothetical protein [Vibrio cholerae]KQA34800.1 hypothetical protein XV74_17740 [Vibrio cholerae]KQA40706.1 hypothetical protein XV75_17920 [Vibrio cholerae]KQA52836.1 hypothetical protein XV79_17730 [Vibrio cholerae]KQA73184.1 hypothetical protein XV84_13455 [Vibrio cholerae]KQA74465.1 hypothetical protein XV85_17800 [Vibrio cholerae]